MASRIQFPTGGAGRPAVQSHAARGGWTKPVVIYGLALVVIPLGVVCDFYYAARGELGLAAIWMMINLCSIGVLGLYVRLIDLRHQLRGQAKSLDRLRHDLGSIRFSTEASIEDANRASVLPDVAPELIAGRLDTETPRPSCVDGIPRLKLVGDDEQIIAGEPPTEDANAAETGIPFPPAMPASSPADRQACAAADSPPPSFEPNMARLRREFADHVRDEEFADAVAAGEEIVIAFPHSTAAGEFRRLRPILLRRLGSTSIADDLFADAAENSAVQACAPPERELPIMAL